MYSENFIQAIKHIALFEDKDGTAHYGIDYKTAKGNMTKEQIDKMKITEVIDYYYKYYWVETKADQIKNKFLSVSIFDLVVNQGNMQILKHTVNEQTSLNVIPKLPNNKNFTCSKFLDDYEIDYLNSLTEPQAETLLLALAGKRIAAYIAISNKKHYSFAIVSSWIKRALVMIDGNYTEFYSQKNIDKLHKDWGVL